MANKIEKFQDLECWLEARKLVKKIYKLSAVYPFSKDFGLKDQVRRASISIMANIAEGFGSYSTNEFIRFLGYSLRSCYEVQSHLYAALDIGYLAREEFDDAFAQTSKCSNFCKAFLKYLRRRT